MEMARDCQICVLHHFATQCEALVIFLQEPHRTSVERLVLSSYQHAWFCYVCPRATEVSLTLCSLGNNRAFDVEGPPWIKSLRSRKTLRIHSKRKKRLVALFIDLTAAYNTVWHRGFTCKLFRFLPDKHMVRMIMELIRNRSFTLTIGDNKPSRLRRLKNGVPQGSLLAPFFFNIYTYDFSSITSKKFAYADDLAILYTSGEWKKLERTPSQDMTTLSAYLQTWRLKLSHTTTVTAAFHLHNRKAKRELKVCNIDMTLPFCPFHTYLGVKLQCRN